MDSIPVELLRRIFELRSDLCYQISRDSWKIAWRENIAVINEEYSRSWKWKGYALEGRKTSLFIEIFNHRELPTLPLTLPSGLDKKMFIFRNHGFGTVLSNFPTLHYFYSIRRYPNATIGS